MGRASGPFFMRNRYRKAMQALYIACIALSGAGAKSVCNAARSGRVPWIGVKGSIFCRKQNRSGKAIGLARRFLRTCWIAESR